MQETETTAYLLLGTNQGDREHHLESARHAIMRLPGVITGVSGIYETEAWGTVGQSPFLNQAIAFRTSLDPEALLGRLLQIERELGRVRRERWGDRTLDIDIIYYGSRVWHSPTLEIPHPRLHLRNFALYPLAELAPDFLHPVFNKSNAELLRESVDTLRCCLCSAG